MELGKIQKLKIKTKTDFGVYLTDENGGKVLLPKKLVPRGANLDDEIEVFVYKDSKGRIISTTKKPFLTVGNVATLTVKDINDVGAFLNIGLERDLFLPFSEQNKKIKVGDKINVYMYIDKSERLAATMYIKNKEYEKQIKKSVIRTYEYEQNADTVYKIIKNRFKGHLIYNDKNGTAEEIYNDFHVSKNSFKKSIGKLLKDKKLKITDKGIFLY